MKIAALDIGGTNIKYGLYNTDKPYDICSTRQTPTHASMGGRLLIESRATGLIEELGECDAIAVSTGGQVDMESGSIIFATDAIPGYTGVNVREILEKRFMKPVAVINDVNAAALGEAHFGAGRGYPDFLCLTYGTGIGGAIIMNGSVYTGATGSAGEFGHMLLHAGDRLCPCGRQGCYEVYGSTTALVNMVEQSCGRRLNGRQIMANLTDEHVAEAFEGWLDEVTWGLVSIAHIFNPPIMVLGGGIMENPIIIEKLNERYQQNVIPSYRNTVLKSAQLGNSAGLLGAVRNCMDYLESIT